MILRQMFSRKWILATLLVALAAAAFGRLGIWQLDRLRQRRAFNEHFAQVRALPALELPTGEDLGAMEFRRVIARGHYDFDEQVALRNQYYADRYGYDLLTPMVLADGQAVLVDRGWIPAEGNAAPSGWRAYDQPGEVTIGGVLRLGQPKAPFGSADAGPAPGETRMVFWNFVDLGRLAAQMPQGLLPVYIQLDPAAGSDAPPLPHWAEPDLTEGPHLGYALQWFGFSVAAVAGYSIHLRRQIGLAKP
jgi:surfeit locus 1 family protein